VDKIIWVTTVGLGPVPVVVGGAGEVAGGVDCATAPLVEIARIARANDRKSFCEIFIGDMSPLSIALSAMEETRVDDSKISAIHEEYCLYETPLSANELKVANRCHKIPLIYKQNELLPGWVAFKLLISN
jgi:hypothetical protein